MRALVWAGVLGVSVATALFAGPAAADDPPVPLRRLVLVGDADMPGHDIRSIFDTSIEACEAACLSDRTCKAVTYNSRARSCFPKTEAGEISAYSGAYSGRVIETPKATVALAIGRAPDLDFLYPGDMSDALYQAKDLANRHVTGTWTAADHLSSARQSEQKGDFDSAAAFTGAALNLTDAPDQWIDYSRLLLAAAEAGGVDKNSYQRQALSAAVNGYLRAETAGSRASALIGMANALEAIGRGRMMIDALRLAQQIQPRDDTDRALTQAIAKYGFHVTDTEVQSDSAAPRICVDFSEPLATGIDYTPFVQLPEAGLSVEAQDNQLCVGGVSHGKRYTLTLRTGLPADSGETLARAASVTLYVRDRSPSVRFPGRAYVLAKGGPVAVPVVTVNTTKLTLDLRRISDRNLIRAIQNDYFGQPIDSYQDGYFASELAEEVWSGTAEVATEVNKDVTTRLPLDEVLKGLAPGIYALKAAVPGVDDYDVPPSTQWFVVSDLGLTTMGGVDGLRVTVRSLSTTDAVAGVAVQLISRSNRVLGEAVTDAEGDVIFPAALTRGTGGAEPALVTATHGTDDLAFLPLTDPEFDLSDRGVAGHPPAPPIDVFLTTDRGAYRAGETVFATALARDGGARAIAGLPLTARLVRPDGQEYSRALAEDGGEGGHVFSLPIAGSAPRGTWRLDVFADVNAPALASQTFLVEDFLPERIDFTLALADGPIRLGDAPDLTIAARYLFGAPGAGLVEEGEVRLSAADGLEAFPGYRFGRHDEPFSPVVDSLPSGDVTDEQGNLTISAVMPEIEDPARPLEMRATVRLREGSGRPVERQVTRALTPSAPMIGIRPGFDDVLPENGEATFRLIAVGPDQTAVPMKVHWVVNRVVTRYQWYQSYGSWSWEPLVTRTRVAEGDASLGGDPAIVTAPVSWGEYELVVDEAGGGHASSSMQFEAGWYAPADASETPDTLAMSLDKPAYAPGETASLRVVPRAAGTALVSVLSNRVIWRKAVSVTAGENMIPVPVTADWGAGAYVTVSVIRPSGDGGERVPVRALGLAYAKVDPGDRRLATEIETAAEAAPRGPLDVAVKVDAAPGDTAYVTIAAVDQGILNLTGFTAPDPEDHYFGQRKLGVAIRDLYGRLIDGSNGALGKVRSGGDAGMQNQLKAPPPTEELVAYFSGPVPVGADGRAHATFDLPAFNGTVKVMAVAWSKAGIGQASADVLVRDPVVVTASLPRFMAPGDKSRLLLEFVHAKGPAGRMGLDVASDGVAVGELPSGFDLAEGGKVSLSIPIAAGDAGIQTISVRLTTPDGKVLTKTLTVPVERLDPAVTRASRFTLAAGKTFTLDQNVFDGLQRGTGQVTLAIGPLAQFDAPGLLAALDRYPYGCTEQITSKALPLLYFEDVASVMGLSTRDNLRTRIGQSITAVLTNQDSNGAFGLWGPYSGDLWLDAYVTDFLSRARAQGFAVPDTAFRAALDNLRNQINYAQDFDANGGPYAYALMVLAREGAAAIGDLRYYADVKAGAFDTPIAAAQLGAALAAYGDQTRADAMFGRAVKLMAARMGKDGPLSIRDDYGTNRRDAAAVLTLATEAGSSVVDAAPLLERIAARPGEDRRSTQEAAWTLLAAHAMIARPADSGFAINGDPVAGPLVRVLEDEALQPLAVENGSGKDTQITLTTYGVPLVPEKAGGTGYAIARSYYTLEGEKADISKVKAGTRLVTVIEVTPFADGAGRLMVADPLPAGFEIDNPSLLASGDVGALDWLDVTSDTAHTEFRQDRFLAAIDHSGKDAFRLAYIVRAISPGTYRHPAASVEDMYRPDVRAHGDTDTVTVTE